MPVRRLNRVVPRDLETICLKCLHKDPSRRYVSAGALAEDLRRFLDQAPILAQPTNRAQKLWCWCRRRPALSLSLLLLQLNLAAGLAGILWEWLRARASEVSLQENLYATDVKLAQAALEENNLGRATTLLHRHVPALRQDSDLRGFEWWYLWNLCRGNERATWHERDTIISCVRFSPDGRLIASAGFDGVVTLWNPEANRSIAHLTGLSGPVSRLALSFSLDGKLLCRGRWHQPPGVGYRHLEVAQSLPAHAAPLGGGGYQLAFTPDSGRLAARLNGDVQVWETAHWQPGPRFRFVDETASLLAFSPDGKVLAAYNDRHLQFWEAATGHRRATSVTLTQPLGLAFDQKGFRWRSSMPQECCRFSMHRPAQASCPFRHSQVSPKALPSHPMVRLWRPAEAINSSDCGIPLPSPTLPRSEGTKARFGPSRFHLTAGCCVGQ